MSKRLYLRGLPFSVGRKSVLEYLSVHGPIEEVKFVKNFVFVEFEKEEDANKVLRKFQGEPFMGRPIVIQPCYPRPKNKILGDRSHAVPMRGCSPSLEIFVTNIPGNVAWQELKDFGRLSGGRVTFCDLVKPGRGKGFIAYATPVEADEAARTLDGAFLGGRAVNVTLRSHSPNDMLKSESNLQGDNIRDNDSTSSSSQNEPRPRDHVRRFGTHTQSRSSPPLGYASSPERHRHPDSFTDYKRIYPPYSHYDDHCRIRYYPEDDLAPWRGDSYRPLDNWRVETYHYSQDYSPMNYGWDSRRSGYEWY